MYYSGRAERFLFYLLILIKEAAPYMPKPRGSPSHEFSDHTTVQPRLYYGRTKRAIISTNGSIVEHHPKVTVEFFIDGETFTLDLIRNMELLAKDHVLALQKNGKSILYRPSPKDVEVCQYNGEIRGRAGSWAAVSTCRGVRGIFHDGKKLRYIEPEGTTISSRHFIYEHSKLTSDNGTLAAWKRFKRNSYGVNRFHENKLHYNGHSTIPQYNGKQRSLYIELVAVVDNRIYRKKSGDLRLIYQFVGDLTNAVSSLLAPLNIYVVLVGVKVWSERDEVYLSSSAERALDDFLDYRFRKLITEMPNDHALLLTEQSFTNNIVGKAYQGLICTRDKSGSVSNLHSNVLGLMAATVAHEIGHNLGMNHDTSNCKCEGDVCVMGPSISESSIPVLWSSCSLNSLAYSLHRGVDYCLRNIPDRLFDTPTCGNGFLEEGEQCDCGMAVGKQRAACRACCHIETCRLRSNASCATGGCCDVQTCQIKPVATVCRAANSECDLTEYCTGKSEFCPDDVHKMDTTPCSHSEAYCVRGKCRSHSSQCRLLWGQSGVNGHELCYKSNYGENNALGNCGYDHFKKTFFPCNKEDVQCGRLHCRHFNDKVEFGASVVMSKVQLRVIKDKITSCSTAVIDMGVDEDPGMVPDGAKCGENKICMNRQCVDVVPLSKRIANENSVCPSDCSKHGVCNTKGNCHCDAGFAPPICQSPGAGGSVDSGPASDINVLKIYMIVMYVIFLGILPVIMLLLLLVYCLNRKRNAKRQNDLSHLKVRTSAKAELDNTGKSSNKKTENIETDYTSKPRFKKEDINVIRNCDGKIKSNNEKRVTLERIIISTGENKHCCDDPSVSGDTTSCHYVNVNVSVSDVRSRDLTKVNPIRKDNTTLDALQNIHLIKAKTKIEAVSSTSQYTKPSNCELSKKAPDFKSRLQDSSNKPSVQELRKMFNS